MQLEVNSRQTDIDEDVLCKAKRLLRFSLSRFKGAISRVKLMFNDVNGPKGGIDKRCRIMVKMKTAGQIVVENDGMDYIETLSICLDRLTRAIRRKIDRQTG